MGAAKWRSMTRGGEKQTHDAANGAKYGAPVHPKVGRPTCLAVSQFFLAVPSPKLPPITLHGPV